MKKLFLALTTTLNEFGKLIEVLMYKGETYSAITAELDGETYTITIRKEDANGNGRD